MNRGMLLAALLCAGCAGQGAGPPDYFSRQDEFAADRARETLSLHATSYDDTYRRVAEVLMDLDCTLRASDRTLGVISASGMTRVLPPEGFMAAPTWWRSCAGHRVTVTLRDTGAGSVVVRAAFEPPSEDADRTFRTLLERSSSLDTGMEVRHAH